MAFVLAHGLCSLRVFLGRLLCVASGRRLGVRPMPTDAAGAHEGIVHSRPVLVLRSSLLGSHPMPLQIWPGAVAMMRIATRTAALVTTSSPFAWFVTVVVLMVYATVALT